MGDRANVVIYQDEENPPLVLYTHWGGSELAEDVARAIQRREQWNDPSYFARILFCEICPDGATQGRTGFGISVGSLPDNEHLLIVIDVNQTTVSLVNPPEHSSVLPSYSKVNWLEQWSFEEICEDPHPFHQRYAKG